MSQSALFFTFFDFFTLIVGVLIGITVHEAAHALTASLLGDPTAKWEGRISLNPLRHLDPMGTLSLFIFHLGWGKPVPYNPNNFKYPTRDAILTALAGPFANLCTALLGILLLKYIIPAETVLSQMISGITIINLSLMVFNLLPIPPLDGSKLLLIIFRFEQFKNLTQLAYIPSVIFIVLIGIETILHIPIFTPYIGQAVSAILFFLYHIS